MQLISALAAGIRGAESGTAYVRARGTSRAAVCYGDWDGRDAISSASGIALDQYGRVVVYVDEPVDVTVVNMAGSAVTNWTESISSSVVEYRGASFTGTDNETALQAVYDPIGLNDVLDNWATSAGSPDFEVLLGGAPTDLQTAIGGLTNPFYDVKHYGAIGNGTTDDTTAIKLAFTAAAVAGGIVYFPAGTYLITDVITIAAGVSVLGAGKECTFVHGGSASDSVFSGYCNIKWLTAKHVVTSAQPLIVVSDVSYTYDLIEHCILDGTNTTGPLLDYYVDELHVRDCEFRVYGAGGAAGYNAGSGAYYLCIDNCFINCQGAFGGTVLIHINRGSITNTRFRNYDGGTYSCIYCRSAADRLITISDCIFGANGGAGTVTAINLNTIAAGDQVTEENNIFDTTITPASFNTTAHLGVRLKSREGRSAYVSGDGAALTIYPQIYDTYFIDCTDTTGLLITASGYGLPGQILHVYIAAPGAKTGAYAYSADGQFRVMGTTGPFVPFVLNGTTHVATHHMFIYRKPDGADGYWRLVDYAYSE